MEICQRSPYDGFSLLEPACCGGWGPREKIHHRGWCYGFPGLYGGFSFLEPLCSGRGLQEKRATVGKELSTIASSLCPPLPHRSLSRVAEGPEQWQKLLLAGVGKLVGKLPGQAVSPSHAYCPPLCLFGGWQWQGGRRAPFRNLCPRQFPKLAIGQRRWN